MLEMNENVRMFEGAYRKLKSYYYYNKNFLMMKRKITEFESDEVGMTSSFEKMAELLEHPQSRKSQEFMTELIDKIDFCVLPKKFESDLVIGNRPISNTISKDKKLKTVNFFIDCPIEVTIIDALWTIYLAKVSYDNKVLSYDIYGNTINESSVFQNGEIDFDSRILFNRYFNKYSDWRNRAFDELERNYKNKKDSLLISLDIKSYFYSVAFDFGKITELLGDSTYLEEIKPLTRFMYRVYKRYMSIISPFRKDLPRVAKKETILPIGLFSSMFLANIYLSSFDKKVRTIDAVKYYGRYVDDMLFVFEKTISSDKSNDEIISDLFVNTNLLKKGGDDYYICEHKSLYIQAEKIKTIYIDHTESKALIDTYNDMVRVIPSQAGMDYEKEINLSNLDEFAYTIENFSREAKLRDLGKIGVDPFKVGRYFSSLAHRYAHINVFGEAQKMINEQDNQIHNFFVGSQRIEFYSSWINYMYFLVMTQRNKQCHSFVSETRREITKLKSDALDKKMYLKVATINKKVKESLLAHLEICLMLALSIDYDMAKRHFASSISDVRKYIKSNMFDHSLIAFPLANYLDYDGDVSYIKMSMKEIGRWPKEGDSFKIRWSPRFIHYDEMLLVLFYFYHKYPNREFDELEQLDSLKKQFCNINYMKYDPFTLSYSDTREFREYVVKNINIPTQQVGYPKELSVAVGSLNLNVEKSIMGCKRWNNISLADKFDIDEIFAEAIKCFNRKKGDIMLLVLPEICFPIYWIGELIRFAKRAQIGVITGIQYLVDGNDFVHNYVATLLPFTSGLKQYRNVFVNIREKNDYSPIEFEELARHGYRCRNKEKAEYYLYNWNNIALSPLVCYEMTDVVVRGLLKGRCDIIAAPVFNPDTTYFSNIIDSAVRDLHSFIIQANTSHYGDSRVTGPYDRDNKDIFKIKGGDNDHVVIGSIDFLKVKEYEANYHRRLQDKAEELLANPQKKMGKEGRKKPDIKPLPARYKRI